jgi:tetratricopeptide (TPR) repeat protein
LSALGSAYGALGRPEAALELYQEALAIAEFLGSPVAAVVALSDVAAAYSALGQDEQAREFSARALGLAAETGDRPAQVSALAGLAWATERLGRDEEALEGYNQAIILLGAMRAEAGSAERATLLGSRYAWIYEHAEQLRQGVRLPVAYDPFQEAYARGFLNGGGQLARGEDFFGS